MDAATHVDFQEAEPRSIVTGTVDELSKHVSILGKGMLDDEDNEARATDRIVELGSGETVGFLYAWEDGVKQPLWFDGERSGVVVVGLSMPEDCTKTD